MATAAEEKVRSPDHEEELDRRIKEIERRNREIEKRKEVFAVLHVVRVHIVGI